MGELKNFCAKLKDDEATRAGLDAHMRKTMGGMQTGINEMQKSMNAQIRNGFLSYAKEAGYEIPEADMDALLETFSTNLHSTMGRIFQQQFMEAMKKAIE